MAMAFSPYPGGSAVTVTASAIPSSRVTVTAALVKSALEWNDHQGYCVTCMGTGPALGTACHLAGGTMLPIPKTWTQVKPVAKPTPTGWSGGLTSQRRWPSDGTPASFMNRSMAPAALPVPLARFDV